jgi:hypothetical protein
MKRGTLIVLVVLISVKLFTYDIPGLTPVVDIKSEATVNINTSAATTLLLVTHSGTNVIRFSYHVLASATTNWSFVYGTGTNCAIGTTTLDGPYALISQTGMTAYDLVVPSGNDLCFTNSQAIQVGGAVSYMNHTQ